MLSLNNRCLNVSNGTLLVSISDGRIQVWSHHDKSECNITDFNAIHVAGDVSKWLIDVHFYTQHNFLFCVSFLFMLIASSFAIIATLFYTLKMTFSLCIFLLSLFMHNCTLQLMLKKQFSMQWLFCVCVNLKTEQKSARQSQQWQQTPITVIYSQAHR
jgi:hypothetical protein